MGKEAIDVLTVIATLEEFNLRRRGEMESNSNDRFSRKVRRTEPLEPGRYKLKVYCVYMFSDEFWFGLDIAEGYGYDYRFNVICKMIIRGHPLKPGRVLRTEEIARGTKAWDIVQSCFYNTPWSLAFKDSTTFFLDEVARESLKGQCFSAKVAVSKTDEENYVQHRTIRPVTYPGYGRSYTERDGFIKSVLGDLNKL